MKFNMSVDINKPRDMVIKYFIDPKYMSEYHNGFMKKEEVSGEAQQTGSKAILYYDMGKRGTMELHETVLDNSLPDSFFAEYHHSHTDNTMLSKFTVLDDNTTKYSAEVEYTEVRGFVLKLISWIYPGMFRKQIEIMINNFKNFVEAQAN